MNKIKNNSPAPRAATALMTILLLSPVTFAAVSATDGALWRVSSRDDCERWRARAAAINTNELPANIRAQRKADADLLAAKKRHTDAIKAQLAAQVGGNSYMIRLAKDTVDKAKSQVDRANREIADLRGRRQLMTGELARLNNNIKAQCTAAAIKYPDLRGPWNSSEGDSTITQTGQNVYILVRYASGGSSSIEGKFIRPDYITFTWRNTFNRYGTGGLTYDADQSYLHGWWIDKSLTPFKKGDLVAPRQITRPHPWRNPRGGSERGGCLLPSAAPTLCTLPHRRQLREFCNLKSSLWNS